MEGQRRREDKPVVICLFNWLRCSEERGMIILALSLDRVQAPGLEQGLQATQYGAAEGACALPFTREGLLGREGGSGDGPGGSKPWSEAAFALRHLRNFKTVIQ